MNRINTYALRKYGVLSRDSIETSDNREEMVLDNDNPRLRDGAMTKAIDAYNYVARAYTFLGGFWI